MGFTLEGDIKFFYLAKTAETLGPADVQVEGSALLRDPGFETSGLISLFSDARADKDDTLPDRNKGLRGGYWGSVLTGRQIGSKLWLLSRSKITPTNLRLWEQYCNEGLGWMMADGVAKTVETVASRGKRKDEVYFRVIIRRKSGDDIFFRFFVNWEYQIIGGF